MSIADIIGAGVGAILLVLIVGYLMGRVRISITWEGL